LQGIRPVFVNSDAAGLTIKRAGCYIDRAKEKLNVLNNSRYRDSLSLLADYVTEQRF